MDFNVDGNGPSAYATPMWTLDEALALVRSLQPLANREGYHIALGGGVLNKGLSFHDVDLYFLPMDGREKGEMLGVLIDYFKSPPRPLGAQDYPDDAFGIKVAFYIGGKRVDVFIGKGVDNDAF